MTDCKCISCSNCSRDQTPNQVFGHYEQEYYKSNNNKIFLNLQYQTKNIVIQYVNQKKSADDLSLRLQNGQSQDNVEINPSFYKKFQSINKSRLLLHQQYKMIPQPNYQFKFVLVGDSSVGKSSILTRFVDDQFHDNLLATIGVDFKFRRININGDEVKIQIWDTAGQETFRSLVSAYYHSADAILIVYDLTLYRSFESILEYWVKQAQNNNKNDACIFLIGNKSDEAAIKRDVLQHSIEAITEKHKIDKTFEVSAKTGQNIAESFTQICKVLINKNKGVKKGEQFGNKGLSRSTPLMKGNDLGQGNQNGGKKKCCG